MGKNNTEAKTYSVNVFLGKDRIIRLVPGVQNRFGIYVPIPEGLEVSFYASPQEIGKAYLKAAGNALKHSGEDLDMRTAAPKYKSFKGFKSQKTFNLQHYCFSSFCIKEKLSLHFFPGTKMNFAY